MSKAAIVRCPDCGCRYYREYAEQSECIACAQALMRRATRAAELTKQAGAGGCDIERRRREARRISEAMNGKPSYPPVRAGPVQR